MHCQSCRESMSQSGSVHDIYKNNVVSSRMPSHIFMLAVVAFVRTLHNDDRLGTMTPSKKRKIWGQSTASAEKFEAC